MRLPAAAAAGEIGLAAVERRPMRSHLTVPGRLDYDARSRIDYDSPVDGIVSRISVAIRQKVARGDSLAEISSTEVGVARDEVKKREADREIARKAADWAATIGDNVQSLLGMLEGHPPLDTVEQEFAGRILGDYREKILGASRGFCTSRRSTPARGRSATAECSRAGSWRSGPATSRSRGRALRPPARARSSTRSRNRAGPRPRLEQSERLLQVSKENLRNLVGGRLDASPLARG